MAKAGHCRVPPRRGVARVTLTAHQDGNRCGSAMAHAFGTANKQTDRNRASPAAPKTCMLTAPRLDDHAAADPGVNRRATVFSARD